MILKYYSIGSLSDLIRRNDLKLAVIMKMLKEISMALRVMHSYYLAHCDVKPQNVLVELVDNIPTCFVTDFGITQILSDSIIASRLFNVTNLRGLSIHYASPEAFSNFRSKQFSKADLKKYDIYSFSCVILEIFNKKTPWS
jgi:serine/threonine protein kinase